MYQDGFFKTSLKMVFTIVVALLVYKAVTAYLAHRELAQRRIAVEIFLRKNLAPEAYADYVLIRDGIVTPYSSGQ